MASASRLTAWLNSNAEKRQHSARPSVSIGNGYQHEFSSGHCDLRTRRHHWLWSPHARRQNATIGPLRARQPRFGCCYSVGWPAFLMGNSDQRHRRRTAAHWPDPSDRSASSRRKKHYRRRWRQLYASLSRWRRAQSPTQVRRLCERSFYRQFAGCQSLRTRLPAGDSRRATCGNTQSRGKAVRVFARTALGIRSEPNGSDPRPQ